MIPPRGFKAEIYPLRHRVIYKFGLSAVTTTQNSACPVIVMSSSDMDAEATAITVNPHNPAYMKDAGPLVRQMSILDKLSLSLKFNRTELCELGETASTVFGDAMSNLYFTWRPIFFSFPEKLDAADDDTGTTVATILGLTKDATNEDVVPLTTNNLFTTGVSNLDQPISTVNAVQVFGDYNMTTDLIMEDHPWDEDLFQDALRRFTNKGALKACVGRTRHVNLTAARPFKNFFIQKFVPRSIRRIVPYSFMAIQINVPTTAEVNAPYSKANSTSGAAHLGVSVIANYHEWNSEHEQGMGSQV